jgi:hypothetical protein
MRIEIPPVLCDPDFRFILLRERDKRPIETDWSTKNNYPFNHPKLLRHLERGGNYGVAGGYGNLVVLDFDDLDVFHKLFDESKLIQRFPIVKTGSGKRHVYLRTENPQPSFRIFEIHLEVRGIGNQVVGPNCIHPSGNRYELLNPEVPEVPVVKGNLNEVIWQAIEAKLGIRRVPSTSTSKPSSPTPNFEGEFLSLPCITELFRVPLEKGRKTRGAKLLAIAAFKDGLDDEKVAELSCWYTAVQSQSGGVVPGPRLVQAWFRTARRKKEENHDYEWSCGEMINLWRGNGKLPPCNNCPIRWRQRDGGV